MAAFIWPLAQALFSSGLYPEKCNASLETQGELQEFLLGRFEAIMQDQAIPYEQKAGALSHAFVLDGYRERGESQKITGEWIVYARHDDVNYRAGLANLNGSLSGFSA